MREFPYGAHPRLDALVRAATVWLGPSDKTRHRGPADGDGSAGGLWGSGCLIAPGWLVTCAHVVKAGLGQDLGDEFTATLEGGHRVPARLAYLLPGALDAAAVPVESDVALVRLLEDVDHRCLWLTDRGDPPAGDVRAYGWYVRGDSGTAPVPWDGICRVSGRDGRCGVTLSPDTEIPPGASGGPVVDTARGALVGLTKARRVSRDGGLAVGITVLRDFAGAVRVDPGDVLGSDPYAALVHAHDKWHSARRHEWCAVQAELPDREVESDARYWSPEDRACALELLADLPHPGDPGRVRDLTLEALYNKAIWTGPEPRVWRDGHGQLYSHRQSVGALPFLRFVKMAALTEANGGTDAARSLLTWVAMRSRALPDDSVGQLERTAPPAGAGVPSPLPPARPAAPAPGRSVLSPPPEGPALALPCVLLTLHSVAWNATRFYWEVALQDDDGCIEPLEADEHGEGVRREELPARLLQPLSRAFTRVDGEGHRAPLEAALPAEYFDLDIHLWPTGTADEPLGAHRQVVIRDKDRRADPQPWQDRWHRLLGSGGLRALRSPPLGKTLRWEQLENAGPEEVPVMCWPAGYGLGRNTIDMAVESGHGVMLWHTDAHPLYGCEDGCQTLHDGASELLKNLRVRSLPDRIRELRREMHRDGRHQGARWPARLALMYDDPGRPLPGMAGILDSP